PEPIAVRHDLQVPARVPPDRQIQQLIAEMTEWWRRLGVAEGDHGEVADEQDRHTRSRRRQRSGANLRSTEPLSRRDRKLAVDGMLRRGDVSEDDQAGGPQPEGKGRR